MYGSSPMDSSFMIPKTLSKISRVILTGGAIMREVGKIAILDQ